MGKHNVEELEEGEIPFWELEEGEIAEDFAAVSGTSVDGSSNSSNVNVDELTLNLTSKELEMKVNSVGDALQGISFAETERSFKQVCEYLEYAFDDLQEMVLKIDASKRDTLIELSFSAIQVVNSVFCSMDSSRQQLYKDIFTSFLSSIEFHNPPLFSEKQIRRMDAMIPLQGLQRDQNADTSPSPTNKTSSWLPCHRKDAACKVEASGEIASSRKQRIDEEPLDGPVLKEERYELGKSVARRECKISSGSSGWEETYMPMPKTTGDKVDTREVKNESTHSSPDGNVEPALGGVSSTDDRTSVETQPTNHDRLVKNMKAILKKLIDKTIRTVTSPATATSSNANAADIAENPLALNNLSMLGRRFMEEVWQKSSSSNSDSAAAEIFNNILGALGSLNLPPSESAELLRAMSAEIPIPHEIVSMDGSKKIRLKPRHPCCSLVLQNTAAPTNDQTTSGSIRHEKAERPADVSPVPSISVAPIDVSEKAWRDVEHPFKGYSEQQKASIRTDRDKRIEEQQKMFAAHKLCLVLDLDHTLLNSALFSEFGSVDERILMKKEELDRVNSQRHLFCLHELGLWTKLRPGIWDFLERASQLYELHISTMGNRAYATKIAKLLDPRDTLFCGRIISRGNDGTVRKTKDLEKVLGLESSVIIIDDTIDVWPHNKRNLIVIERYAYFPCSRREFRLSGPSLFEIGHDERQEDGTLASVLGVLERVHEIFFSHSSIDEADVRNILAAEQKKILHGCCILFSRVIPVGEPNPERHRLWQTAEQLGAVCTSKICERVTHVVANASGTSKANWARTTGRFVVSPYWVEASAFLFKRAKEADFAVKP